ncbi:c-type cytochrome [Rufibacter quisquiliarum]|uniref:Mono/diheme cytochrome c family protein n=1 Tax=Rufibacter quisquiliarum TaxID=1549639 RepID=A0A839GJS8_9BACT|nr:cytochrome c [Rufibacter quisquiliarum]MBA9075845.1 mono/diheme cytochrome c family protein [Rufibacter quisquiliarum]
MRWRNLFLVAILGIAVAGCFTERKDEGQLLYTRHCASCHLENGEGLRGVIPPLLDSDYAAQHRAELACLIRNGINGPIQVNGKTYNQPMPGNNQLTEADITNIINYLHKEFNSPIQKISFGEVRDQMKACP